MAKSAMVTAGFMCAPEDLPRAYMDAVIAMAKAIPMANQFPCPPKDPIPMLKGLDGLEPFEIIRVIAADPARSRPE
jgi:hypothetical protein